MTIPLASGVHYIGNQSLNETVIDYFENLPWPMKNLSYHRNISRNNVSFAFVYSLHFSCEENFYGDSCVIHCQPRNNDYGHKKCFPNGTSVCLPGWRGEQCKERKLLSVVVESRVRKRVQNYEKTGSIA